MCGITGVFSSRQNKYIPDQILRMNSNLSHRGPDDDGIWYSETIGFGHRRLSILELSDSGAQPMHSLCGRYVIAFNGEIYNHLDLRNQLLEEGASIYWKGQSDTESLIEAIAFWGLDKALKLANGMFAISLWDKAENQLSLARDRMGEKPLYWGWAGSDIIFGSELKALKEHPNFNNSICRDALSQFLTFMYVPAPRSIYSNIFKLEPGTILTIDMGFSSSPPANPIRPDDKYDNFYLRRYWSLNEEIETARLNVINDEVEAISLLSDTLGQAVKRQMISDVPLGAFLSGGIDSSAIVSLMQLHSDRPVKTFTIGFEDSFYDESLFADAVSKHFGTDHTNLLVTEKEAMSIIPILPYLYDEPFADSSQIPSYLVSSLAREKVTVALTGDGGDELFGGYDRYLWGEKIWDRFAGYPYIMRRALGNLINNIPVNIWNKTDSLHKAFFAPNKPYNSSLGDKAHKLGSRLKSVKSNDDLYRSLVSVWDISSGILKNAPSKQSLSLLEDSMPKGIQNELPFQMMVQDMRTYLPDDILCKVDRASMGVSLETRAPFLDSEVLKLAFRLPMRFKIKNRQSKWILRQLLYQHIPQSIMERPKAGFGIPIGQWLRGPLNDWASDLLSQDNIAKGGFFDPLIINKIWSEHLSGSRDWTSKIWTILMFQAWYGEQ